MLQNTQPKRKNREREDGEKEGIEVGNGERRDRKEWKNERRRKKARNEEIEEKKEEGKK